MSFAEHTSAFLLCIHVEVELLGSAVLMHMFNFYRYYPKFYRLCVSIAPPAEYESSSAFASI